MARPPSHPSDGPSGARYRPHERGAAQRLPAGATLRGEAASLVFDEGRAFPSERRIEINPEAIRTIGKGGLVWLIAHEAFHVSDTGTPEHHEGNANGFAHRMRTLLERKPAIYTWRGSRRRVS